MKRCSAVLLVATTAVIWTTSVQAQNQPQAATLPAVKVAGGNKVPDCATPGRLMAFLAERNSTLDGRFSSIATAYMRHGEELGVRWDYAFFQMILETGNLGFKRGNGKPGSVKPSQNNFAGLGATGGGEPGEAFASIDAGVKAHLQHLVMYTGERIDDPVAERTRKVQEWGVLTSWQKGFKRQITFADLAAKWAPGSNGYVRDIASVGSGFYDGQCGKADPKPHLVQEARKGLPATLAKAETAGRGAGVELARQANERARGEGDATRSALGATAPVSSAPAAKTPDKALAPANAETAAGLTILNATASDSPSAPDVRNSGIAPTTSTQTASVQTASAAISAKTPPSKTPATAAATTVAAVVSAKAPPAATPPASVQSASSKCRVWTASYGGAKSVIIRSSSDQHTNFTVLDVNEGQESRETDAYISAYAKGGQKIGDFSNQNAALDKAFQLCPEG